VLGLPETIEGYIGLLIITDYLSKFPFAYPIKSKTKQEISSKLFEFITTFGPPKELISDRGKEFLNDLVDELCEKLAINRRVTSAYNPRCNGMTERLNQTLLGSLKKQSFNDPHNWTRYLPLVLLAYRSRIHSSTKHTPYELLFGRKMNSFDNWCEQRDEDEELALTRRSAEIKNLFEKTLNDTKKNLEVAQSKQINTQNKQKNVSSDFLDENFEVYIRSEKIQNKLEPLYDGPYFVVKQTETGNYKLRDKKGEILKDSFPRWRLKLTNEKPNDEIQEIITVTSKPNDSNEFGEVEKILEHKKIGRGFRYFVKWKNEPSTANSWIPGSYFQDKQVLINYHKNCNEKKKQKKKSILNVCSFNLLLNLALIFCFLGGACGQRINDSFNLCHLDDQNRIVSLNFDCKPQRLLSKSLYDGVVNVWVLAKNNYVINDHGYECFKIRNVRYMNFSFTFEKTEMIKRETIQLSRIECLAMVESKRCDNHPMTCNQNECSYRKTPDGDFSWFSNKIFWNYECVFKKRLIYASTTNSTVFNFALNSCKPNDLFCLFYDSIVVWNDSSLMKYPYFRLFYGSNYTRKNSLVYSKSERYLFQLTRSFSEFGLTLYSTTDGTFIVFENSTSLDYKYAIFALPLLGEKRSLIMQKDIDSLILAESDFNRFYLENSITAEQAKSSVRSCVNFLNHLRAISQVENTFHTITDLHGNNLHVFSQNGVLLLPICKVVHNVSLLEHNECFRDLPVKVTLNGSSSTLFLTKNNFLKTSSRKINCELINDRFILPSYKQTIVRVGNVVKLFDLSNVIEETIHLDKVNISSFNFRHHSEILNGYDALRESSDQPGSDDIDGKFYSLPNDITDTTNDLVDNVHNANKFMRDKINKLESSLILVFKSLSISILFVFFLILCFMYYRCSNRCKRKQNLNVTNFEAYSRAALRHASEIIPLEDLAHRLKVLPDIGCHRDYDMTGEGDSVISQLHS
jgi:hypothetical protein